MSIVVISSCNTVNQQDYVMDVSLTGTLNKPFLDHHMVPVTLQGKETYCYYSKVDYKKAVDANARIIAGDSVIVTIKPEKPLIGAAKYRITNTVFIPKANKTPVPWVCDSTHKGGGAIGKPIPVHKQKSKPTKTVKALVSNCFVPSQSCQGVTIYINGNGAQVNIGERDNGYYPIFDQRILPKFNNLPCDTTIPRIDLK